MTAPTRPRPLVLALVAGLGEREGPDGNAVRMASTPTLAALAAGPRTTLAASGPAVGLPKGRAGSGDVGLRVLAAGRVLPSALVRVDAAVADKSIRANPVIAEAVKIGKHHFEGRLHLFTLLSDGGGHASQNHLFAIIDAAAFEELPVVVHAFLDGRDAPPKSAGTYLDRLESFLDRGKKGAIGTISGRSFAMDQGQRWERTNLVFKAIVRGVAPRADTWLEVLNKAYDQRKADDEIEPTRLADYSGMKGSFVSDYTATDRSWRWIGEENALALHLRPDGLAQLSAMLLRQGVPAQVEADLLTDRGKKVTAFTKQVYATLTPQDAAFGLPAAFPEPAVAGTLGEVIAAAGLTQLACVEGDEERRWTSFFRGPAAPRAGEERVVVPSPRDAAKETGVAAVARAAVEAIEGGEHDFILVDLAAADRAAHTGDLAAATRAVEAVDAALGAVLAAVRAAGGALVVTADHGNCEQMKDPRGQPHPAHTANPVPLYYAAEADGAARLREGGSLADVAPTLLELLGVPAPAAMTGQSLLSR
jgi:2,3-bisphosphoglycerate-independent phosphoglycerate mutase